ncbi:unnamed protein product [Phytophthora fragariaefolia]|uniref:Unnamed protein product n=1 Tax=Phytophthora fragariaefolia TaxID=1490495 RepID=A0A9W7CWP8_9STRA|nr:unnamed protein product [Phytophthora fragariaefolia]
MTVDVRGPNEQVELTTWPMPILEVEFDRLRGAKYYFSLDFLQSFWQFGTAPSSQEIHSILTEEGVTTPTSTRVLMGGTNSVAHVQSTVQAMFEEVHNKSLLIWIDDLLGYSSTAEGLLALLRKVIMICVKRGLKLNPRKCKVFMREAKWCGRVVSGDSVKYDPERIAALQALSSPVTGQQLQQFVCALNWVRMSVPAYNKLVEPLTNFMEKVYVAGSGRKKTNVRGVQLATIGWGADEEQCLEACRGALQNALQLAHPDPEKRLCVFTHASDLHWGAVITQVPREHLSREFSEQKHEPLIMLSGSFSGAARRWAIVEKEAYAIVETCKRADYLVQRPDGFLLFTDHRNLWLIFAPTTVMASVPKYTADKLHRWAMILMGFRYEILDIARMPMYGLIFSVDGFVFNYTVCDSPHGFPSIPTARLHLSMADGRKKPNEVLHWDYLHLGKASTGEEYVLVLKDDASHFVWLISCAVATADTTYVALIDCFASFGVCHTWVSDQGIHFKNRVIEALEHLLGAHHRFTTARYPWANGTVEVVMREVLRCARVLLSEWRMATTEWPRTIKLV